MTTTISTQGAAGVDRAFRPSVTSRPSAREPEVPTPVIMLATDAAATSDAAVGAVAGLARLLAARVRVATALDPLPLVSADGTMLYLPPPEADRERTADIARRVRDQIARSGGDPSWPLDVRIGSPALALARAASDTRADLIVTGHEHHGVVGRMLGAETVLQLLRIANAPVLAVRVPLAVPLHRVVVATDFSEASLVAARVALGVLESGAVLHLAHVAPARTEAPEQHPDDAAFDERYRAAAAGQFEQFVQQLDVPAGVAVITKTIDGKVSEALIAYADEVGADIIAAGTRGRGLLSRMLVGSVATALVRYAHCATLVVPPLGQHTALRVRRPLLTPGTPACGITDWPAMLAALTTRAAGRLARLELHDPDIGVQAEASGYPFLGASYDPHDAVVEIMLGDTGRAPRHLTHVVGDVRSIDVLRDANGVDTALRIATETGQALLLFEPR